MCVICLFDSTKGLRPPLSLIHPTLFLLLFRAYAVVDMNQVLLYLPPEKQSVNVKRHLESEVSELLLVGFIQ